MREVQLEELELDDRTYLALGRLLARLDGDWWDQVQQVILYGQDSQDEPHTVDLLIVCDHLDPHIEDPFQAAADDISTQTGVHIAAHFLPRSYLDSIHKDDTALYKDLQRDAVVLQRPSPSGT
jgi:hypothetical protein